MYSMTAFAAGNEETRWGHLSLEIRSLNHRFLELGVRLPEELRGLEPAFRELVSDRVQRGKLDVMLRWKRGEGGPQEELTLNEGLCDNLAALADTIRSRLPDASAASDLEWLRWPGMVKEPDPDLGQLAGAARTLLERVLADLLTMREREGARLRRLIEERLDQIGPIVSTVQAQLPEIRERLGQRLHEKIAALQVQLDRERLEQEVAVLLQRMDVDEELDRLLGHVTEVRRNLDQSEPIGRRLDFLMQELHREANTLGSKSADIGTTQASVDLKVLIEQMREQVQNIE